MGGWRRGRVGGWVSDCVWVGVLVGVSGRAGGQIDGWLGGLMDGSFKHEYYTDTRPVYQ